MAKNPNPKSKTTKIKLSSSSIVAIIVAMIGCFGTICAAIIGGGLSVASQFKIADLFQPQTSLEQRDDPSAEWQNLLTFTRNSPCYTGYVPEYKFEGQDQATWLEENIRTSYFNEELFYTPDLSNDPSNIAYIYYNISNTSGRADWAQLSKQITVTVRYMDEAPSQASVFRMSGCGGIGEYRYFLGASLSSQYPEYNLNLTADDPSDYFTLQQGEFEIFVLEFVCQQPGLYAVTLNIPVTYRGNEGVVKYTGTPGIFCPDETYSYMGDFNANDEIQIYEIRHFRWNGSGYDSLEP